MFSNHRLKQVLTEISVLDGYACVFTHVVPVNANLLDQKKCLHKKRVYLPQDLFGTRFSRFWNTNPPCYIIPSKFSYALFFFYKSEYIF